jgi:hypothetical protein
MFKFTLIKKKKEAELQTGIQFFIYEVKNVYRTPIILWQDWCDCNA